MTHVVSCLPVIALECTMYKVTLFVNKGSTSLTYPNSHYLCIFIADRRNSLKKINQPLGRPLGPTVARSRGSSAMFLPLFSAALGRGLSARREWGGGREAIWVSIARRLAPHYCGGGSLLHALTQIATTYADIAP